jgi:hypothetical protein
MYTLQLTIEDIENLPNFRKRTVRGEYSSACPVCGGDPSKDTDRFRFWVDKGNYWCRKCDIKGFVVTEKDDAGYSDSGWYKKVEEMKRRQEDVERQRILEAKKAIAAVSSSQLDAEYHIALMNSPDMVGYVSRNWGVSVDLMKKYMIGYARRCPTYSDSDSITIPVYYDGDLFNIRHRILRVSDRSGKYRPQIKSIPPALFNADSIDGASEVVVVEGEFKAIVIEDAVGIPTVGTPGAQVFKDKWVRFFDGVKKVFVALDPNTTTEARKIASAINRIVDDVMVVEMPVKPDDFFVKYGGSTSQFMSYLRYSRHISVALCLQ